MREFTIAIEDFNGWALATTITPVAPPEDPGRLYSIHHGASKYNIRSTVGEHIADDPNLSDKEVTAWVDIFEAYYNTVGELLAAEEASNTGKPMDSPFARVFEAWKEFSNQLIHGYKTYDIPAWTIPCLYVAAEYLRKFAIQADEQIKVNGDSSMLSTSYDDEIMGDSDENHYLQEAARQINQIFSTAISDRYPNFDPDREALRLSLTDIRYSSESRMWATYHVANTLFNVYFKLNRINLAKNLLRAIQTTPDIPELSQFPKSDQVTFNYYTGVLHFLEDDFDNAEKSFNEAWQMCDKKRATKHCEIILAHLIPCHIMAKNEVPSQALLAMFPRLEQLFGALSKAIKQGDLVSFDAAVEAGYRGFVKRRIYLAVQLARIMVERNIFRKVMLSGGGEPRTRVPLTEFGEAYRKSAQDESIVDEEVEWQIVNLINKVRPIFSLNFRPRVDAACPSHSSSPRASHRHPSISFSSSNREYHQLTRRTGPHERLHLPRAQHGRPEQERCLSGYRVVNPFGLCSASNAHPISTLKRIHKHSKHVCTP